MRDRQRFEHYSKLKCHIVQRNVQLYNWLTKLLNDEMYLKKTHCRYKYTVTLLNRPNVLIKMQSGWNWRQMLWTICALQQSKDFLESHCLMDRGLQNTWESVPIIENFRGNKKMPFCCFGRLWKRMQQLISSLASVLDIVVHQGLMKLRCITSCKWYWVYIYSLCCVSSVYNALSLPHILNVFLDFLSTKKQVHYGMYEREKWRWGWCLICRRN